MKFARLVATTIAMLAVPAAMMGQRAANVDPVNASPDKYKVMLENDHVRVVGYTIEPGARDEWHTHPPKLSYVLDGGTLRITLADSTSFPTEDRHWAGNTGATTIRVLLVELRTSKSY